MTKTKLIIMTLLLILASSANALSQTDAETVTVTTYYPSAYGEYSQLRLIPTDAYKAGDACSDKGAMIYSSIDNQIYYCNGTSWSNLSGYFTLANDTNLYPSNLTDWNIAIGRKDTRQDIKIDINGKVIAFQYCIDTGTSIVCKSSWPESSSENGDKWKKICDIKDSNSFKYYYQDSAGQLKQDTFWTNCDGYRLLVAGVEAIPDKYSPKNMDIYPTAGGQTYSGTYNSTYVLEDRGDGTKVIHQAEFYDHLRNVDGIGVNLGKMHAYPVCMEGVSCKDFRKGTFCVRSNSWTFSGSLGINSYCGLTNIRPGAYYNNSGLGADHMLYICE